jgi:hypothetical protein
MSHFMLNVQEVSTIFTTFKISILRILMKWCLYFVLSVSKVRSFWFQQIINVDFRRRNYRIMCLWRELKCNYILNWRFYNFNTYVLLEGLGTVFKWLNGYDCGKRPTCHIHSSVACKCTHKSDLILVYNWSTFVELHLTSVIFPISENKLITLYWCRKWRCCGFTVA